MNIMSDLLDAVPFLAPIGAGVALLWILGRGGDRTADQHDVADYRPALHPSRRDWPLLDRQGPRRLRPGALAALADPIGSQVTPPLARRMLVDQAVPTLPASAVRGIAAEWLREIAAAQQAKAGIRPAYATADRDMTGAFPVVAVA